MNTKTKFNTYRLTLSGIMIALATAIALVCGLIPGLSLPYGGGFTVASMLPIILVAYIFGMKWGLFTSLVYAVVQIALDMMMGRSSVILALFLPIEEGGQPIFTAICIILLDYVVAYGVLCLGGAFRKMKSKRLSLAFGALLAVSLRYVAHILSGYIFYGAYAEWFFTEAFEPKLGEYIMSAFDGQLLALIYSIIYNGLYMIPEIIITTAAAFIISAIPQIKKAKEI